MLSVIFFFFFLHYRSHRVLHVLTHSFPTRRSSDLRRVSVRVEQAFLGGDSESGAVDIDAAALEHPILLVDRQAARRAERRADFQIARHDELLDRKSTRLNSSH